MYEASVKLKLYTRALPIIVPVEFRWSYKSIVSLFFGVPDTLLTLILFPISKGILAVLISSVSLGFSTSMIVVDILSTSYPLT